MISFSQDLEPCLARLGTTPEDKPSFVKEIYAIDDIETLQKIIIRKERERSSIANDLEAAARIGIVISETNEALQIKLEDLERENKLYSQELEKLRNLSEQDERVYLQQELDQARKELTVFRKEMDGLSAQLNDMASEMIDSRSKVSVYAKKLAEVEQKLAATRDVNSNLQSLLDKALTSQKQSSSNTSHLVKNIQLDLSRVVSENEQLRARIVELENQQTECEDKLATMVIQAKEYATRLQQAQDTIHKLQDEDYHIENKGAVFSAEFRQEMQKEIERNLNLRNEIRHRIITADSNKDKTEQGLKYLVSEKKKPTLVRPTAIGLGTTSNFMTRGIPPTSISTRFFQRLASQLDQNSIV